MIDIIKIISLRHRVIIILGYFIQGDEQGKSFMTEKLWDSEIEAMPLNNLKELQLKRLKKIVDYVYRNNRFYRDRLKDAKIESQIYLFPMIQLNCQTKRGKKFDIYSIGSETNFMIYSNF